ncbi:MAG: aminotransferase class I/II-fold pyridoxal phosphate-dependent enzyme [Candidatus Orphnella occulta]|nr:aminotransferase class I/II-fold pyridoxal phosphate-dependent enzyme [Candidatus Orphnella occulta]
MKKLKRERIFLSPPHMGGEEMKFVHAAFKSNYIAPLGPQVDAFEKEFAKYTGISYAVAVSSGTAAMHLALRSLGIGPGDKIVASTLTFIGGITPAIFQGAEIVFVDCDRTSWNMDPNLLKDTLEDCRKRGILPSAVIPTDLYGQCVDYKQILSICKKYNVPVIADAAEAMGAKYRNPGNRKGVTRTMRRQWSHAGDGAKAAIFSFNGNKIITTSGGGMLVSDDKKFIEQARFLSQQARELTPHYEHKEIGYNYRMSNVLAAIGRGQLKILDDRVNQRRKIFKYYYNALKNVPGIDFMPEPTWSRSNRWLTVILIKPEKFGASREDVRLALEAENIEARPVWKPMHMQPVFNSRVNENHGKKVKRYRTKIIGGNVAEDLFNRGLCLPSGTAITKNGLNRIIKIIIGCYKKIK